MFHFDQGISYRTRCFASATLHAPGNVQFPCAITAYVGNGGVVIALGVVSNIGEIIQSCRGRRTFLDQYPSEFSDQCSDARVFTSKDRKSVVSGKSVSVGLDLGGRRIIKK